MRILASIMEDYLVREIDKIGEMLMFIVKRLGLMEDVRTDYTVADVKAEFEKAGLPLNLDALLQKDNPVSYLVRDKKLSDSGLEAFIDIVFHSDLEEEKKAALLEDALAYLDGKGYYSFRLHSFR